MNLSVLHVDGKYFREANGTRWHYASLSAYSAFTRYLMTDGPEYLVAPNLAEYRALAHEGGYDGEIVLKVYRFAKPPNAFALEPWSYYDAVIDRMPRVLQFTEFCNARGFRVDWTGGDAQGWDANGPRGRQQHTNLFCRELSLVTPTNFITALNEEFKNGGLEGFALPQWGTYLRSSGKYYGDTWDARTNLDWINLHTDRSVENGVDKWVGKAVESAPYLWTSGPAPVADEMMGFGDVATGSRSTNREYALLAGLSTAWLGTNFHSDDTMNGNALGPNTRACCVNYFRGVAAAVSACKGL